MNMMQVQIGQTFPVVLGLFQNGTVALLKPNNATFKAVFEQAGEGGVGGTFMLNEFSLYRGDDLICLQYNMMYPYKEMPLLLDWLKQQTLQW